MNPIIEEFVQTQPAAPALPDGLHPTLYRIADYLERAGKRSDAAIMRVAQVLSEYNKHNMHDLTDRPYETFDQFIARCKLPPTYAYVLDQTDYDNPFWVQSDVTAWVLGYAIGFDTVVPASLEVEVGVAKKQGRPARLYMVRGKMRTLTEAASVLGVTRQTLYNRLSAGKPLDGSSTSTAHPLRDAPPYQQRYAPDPAPEPENRAIEDLPHWHSYGHPECLTNAQRKLILATDPTFRDNPWMLWPQGQVPEEFGPEPERLQAARDAARYTGELMLRTREIDAFPPAVPIEPWR